MAMMSQVSDMGVMINAMIASVATTAAATVATIASTSIALDQYNIANRQYKLAKKRWDRFKDFYIPCERTAISTACMLPQYVELYAMTRGKYVGIANNNMSKINLGLTARSLCTPAEINRRNALLRAEIIADVSNLAYRTEETRKDAKDDIRWNQRSGLLNLGRDLNATAAKATQMGVSTLDLVQNKVSDLAQGAAQAAGYQSSRRQFEIGDASTGNRESRDIFPVLQSNIYSPQGGVLSPDVAYNQNKAITAAT